jgi:hypothetical protein
MKPFLNQINTFQRIRLSPDPTLSVLGNSVGTLQRPRATRAYLFLHLDRLRPFALPRLYPWPGMVVTPPATTASLPWCQHWLSANLPLRKLTPGSGVPRVASVVLP